MVVSCDRLGGERDLEHQKYEKKHRAFYSVAFFALEERKEAK